VSRQSEASLGLVAEEIGIGAGIGVGLAILGAMVLRSCTQRGWIAEPWVGLPVVALAFGARAKSEAGGA